MARLLAIVRSFWFALSMALWNLISMAGELMAGEDPWFSVFMIMLWVYFGWSSIRRDEEEVSDDGEN